jgi:ABC-type Mn2+/Zn2+ transport system permease subunit
MSNLSELLPLYLPGLVAGVAIAIMCALLSPLVVLKRMAFVGQGISHAAFGGIGVAALLAAWGGAGAFAGTGAGRFLVVLAFCLAAAFTIAALTQRGGTQADTAIGIVLVGAMALGVILLNVVQLFPPDRRPPGLAWESILFGSIFDVGWAEAWMAWGVAAALVGATWWARRNLMFWDFDEAASPAFGVPAGSMKYLLIILLTVAIVTSMRLVGVVLATALLVLPGAAALRVSDRLSRVLGISLVCAIVGVVGGLLASLAIGSIPPGATIVMVLVGLFALGRGAAALRVARRRA